LLLGSRVLKYMLLVLEVTGYCTAYAAANHVALTLLAPLLLLLVENSYVVLISAISYSLILVMLVSQSVAYLISIPTALIATTYFILYSGLKEVLKPIYTLLLILAPIYLASARTIPIALASALSLMLPVAYEYYRLSKSRVTVISLNSTTYLNDYVNVTVEVTCPGSFKYYIQVGDELYSVKNGVNYALDNVRIQGSRLGVGRQSIKVAILDLRQLARVEHGPYVIEYTVIPKFAELYKHAERVLMEYSKHVSLPLIAKLLIQLTPTSPITTVDLSALKPSTTGTPSTFSAETLSGERLVREGVGKVSGMEFLEKHPQALTASVMRSVKWSLKQRFEVKITWRIPRRLMEKMIQAVRGYIGEYLGVREYTPGDSLKLIHWKKSARRSDIVDLAVKVYSVSDVDRHAHPARSIVIADLTATNVVELDLLLQTLYSHILSNVETSVKTPSEFYIYLITPRGETYFLKGKAVDVLLGLNTIISEEKLMALYDYTSWPRLNPPITHALEEGALSKLIDYFDSYGTAIVRDLKSYGIERGAIVLIHSKALSFKYYVISSVFTKYGFAVATPGIGKKMSY